ncbi:MAG: hypothetical protein IPI76_00490 [Chloracidobacterium sp.]|nr:hypothetical protein [Chloracidobacterium sp.]
MPWLFANDEFHYRFVRQGGGSVAAQSALVAIPQDWSLRELDEQTSVQFIGTIGDLARSAYTFHGLVQAEDNCGNAYKLSTGNAADTEESMSGLDEDSGMNYEVRVSHFVRNPCYMLSKKTERNEKYPVKSNTQQSEQGNLRLTAQSKPVTQRTVRSNTDHEC